MENSTEQEQYKENRAAQQEKMMRGTMWFTLADILSRLLGAIYIIPWYAWMGTHDAQANALFSMGYNIYALFLLISTAGIPVAIAREVAKYNAMGDENLSYRLVRQMFVFMTGLGIISALVMYFASPLLASWSGGGSDLIPVMRSLSLSILIFPGMSVIRGYFQGLNNVKPIALSQIYEQIVRVIWMLVLTFMIVRIGFAGGDWKVAVMQSTLAAFIGMLGSCAVLLWFLIKEKMLRQIIFPGPAKNKIHPGRLLVQTIYQSIPFIVIGSAIQIFKIVDQMSFSSVMHIVTHYSDAQLQVFFSYFSANTDKLTMILIGEAMTLGAVALPLITSNFVEGNYRETAHLISYDIQLFAAFMFPAVMGMVVLSYPIYNIFYGAPSSLQISLFVWTLIQAILLALYTMLAPILQALRYSRVALRYFAMTFVAKLVLQIPAILIFRTYGPLVATTLAMAWGCWLLIRKIHEVTHFSKKNVTRGVIGITILTVIMMFVTAILYVIIAGLFFWLDGGRIKSFIEVLVAGGGGFFAYIWLAAQLGLLEKLLGARGTSLRRRLHI